MGASKELDTVDRIVSPNIGRIHRHVVGCTLRAVSRDTWRHCLGFVPTAVVARRLDPATGREAPRHTLIALSLLSSTTRPSPLATACIATSASRCQALPLGLRNRVPSLLCGDGIRSCIISGAHPIYHCTSRSNRHFTREMHAACNQTPFTTFFPRFAPPVQLQQQSSLATEH